MYYARFVILIMILTRCVERYGAGTIILIFWRSIPIAKTSFVQNILKIFQENSAIRKKKELKEEELPFTKNFSLVVSYPANRAILEIPERIRGFRPAIHPFDALENALESIPDFRSFIALFRMNENSSRKNLQNDHYARWQAKQVQAVNDAICKVIPEFGELHVTQKPFRISVLKKEKKLDFYSSLTGKNA